MKHKVIWQLVVPLLGLCVLFMLLATEPAKVQARQEPVEISVILRETENGTWSATRQGMEQAAMDLNVELRVLTLSQENDAEEQRDLLEREVAVLESIDLRQVPAGDYILLAQPLKYGGLDGAQVRALLVEGSLEEA